MLYWIWWENGDPFDATDLLLCKRCREAIDTFLRVVVKDLNDFFRKEDVSRLEGPQGAFGCVDRQINIEAASSQQILPR